MDYTPNDEVIAEMRVEITSLKARLAQVAKERDEMTDQVEKDKHAREEWSSIIKEWAKLCASHDSLRVLCRELAEAIRWMGVEDASDGGNIWCTVRNRSGASKWFDAMRSALQRAETLTKKE